MKSITFTFTISTLQKLNCNSVNQRAKTFKFWYVAQFVSAFAYQFAPDSESQVDQLIQTLVTSSFWLQSYYASADGR